MILRRVNELRHQVKTYLEDLALKYKLYNIVSIYLNITYNNSIEIL